MRRFTMPHHDKAHPRRLESRRPREAVIPRRSVQRLVSPATPPPCARGNATGGKFISPGSLLIPSCSWRSWCVYPLKSYVFANSAQLCQRRSDRTHFILAASGSGAGLAGSRGRSTPCFRVSRTTLPASWAAGVAKHHLLGQTARKFFTPKLRRSYGLAYSSLSSASGLPPGASIFQPTYTSHRHLDAISPRLGRTAASFSRLVRTTAGSTSGSRSIWMAPSLNLGSGGL